MSLRSLILCAAFFPTIAQAGNDASVLPKGVLNTAENELSTLHLAKLCGASPKLLAEMEPIAKGDIYGMKQMFPSAAKEIDAAAANGVAIAERRFAQLGKDAKRSVECKQSIAIAQSSFNVAAAGR